MDELYSGVFSVGGAAIQSSLEVSNQGLIATLLVVPAAFALLLEPLLFLLADRWPRRWFVAGGLAVMAAASMACAFAPSAVLLAVFASVSALAGSCGVEVAQATLVDLYPDDRERAMARWTLAGAIGDLAAPLVLVVLAVIGLGWRAGFAVMAAVLLALAVTLARAPFPAPAGGRGDDDEPGLWASFTSAVRERRLMGWLLATTLCELLDELLVVLAAVHLREHLGAGVVARSIVIGALVFGGVAGVAMIGGLVARFRPARLCAASAAVCAVSFVAWLAAPWIWLSAILFALVGATSALLYPLTMAQSYAALPGRSGAVHAASRVLAPLSLGLPLVVAWIADHAGTYVALATIAVAPVTIAVLAISVAPAPRAVTIER